MTPHRLVAAGDVYSFDLLRGVIEVRSAYEDTPLSGTIVSFAERRWIVTRRNVVTPGGRTCYHAALLPPATPRWTAL